MKPLILVNPNEITQEIKTRINQVKTRILFLSPSVGTGEEREGKKEDFESMGNQNIGSGGFGKVYKVRHRESGNIYAIKVMMKSKIMENDLVEQTRLEIKIMYSLNHEHIVKLYNHFEDEDNIYLILFYCSKGELFQRLKCVGTIDEKAAAQFMREVISAVEYLHSLSPPIIHRDIKPENILLDENDRCKLGDFGWSNFFTTSKRMTYCGTPAYLAPEMIKQAGHDKSLDLWNLGVLLFELLSGKPPFEGNTQKELFYNIEHIKIIWPKDFSKLAKDLISKLLKVDPKQRISITEMRNHPWFKSIPALKPVVDNSIEIPAVTPYQIISKKSEATVKREEDKKIAANKVDTDFCEIKHRTHDQKDILVAELNLKIAMLTNQLQEEKISIDRNQKEENKLKQQLEEYYNKLIVSEASCAQLRQQVEELNKLKVLENDRDKLLEVVNQKNNAIIQLQSIVTADKSQREYYETQIENLNRTIIEANNKIEQHEDKIKQMQDSSNSVQNIESHKVAMLESKIEEMQYKMLNAHTDKIEANDITPIVMTIKEIFNNISADVQNLGNNAKQWESFKTQYTEQASSYSKYKEKLESEIAELISKCTQEKEECKNQNKLEAQQVANKYITQIDQYKRIIHRNEDKLNQMEEYIQQNECLKKEREIDKSKINDNELLIKLLTQEKQMLISKITELNKKIGDLEYLLALKKDEEFKKKISSNNY